MRLPIVNFLDTKTILSWLAARKIILDIGNRFQIRVQIFISYFIAIDAVMLLMLFGMASGFISGDVMTRNAWIVLTVHASILTTILLGILLPSSYVN